MMEHEGIEDRSQLQGGMGDASMEIHEGSNSKLSEEATNGDMASNSVVHDDKGSSSDTANASKFQNLLKPAVQSYRVACLNCGAQLHVELPHPSGSFQCCQCHAVHKIIQDTFAMSDQSKKRKRNKDKPISGKPDDKEPRELSIYNKFIKEHLAALKNENPGLSHKDAYKQVSAMWSSSPLNPKRLAGGEMQNDPSLMGQPPPPAGDPHGGSGAYHYPQDSVHDAHAAAVAAAQEASSLRAGSAGGGDHGGGPEHPPLQPA